LGHKSATPLTWDALIPTIFDTHQTVKSGAHNLHGDLWREFTGSISGLVLIVGNFLAFAGIEMNAIHARELRNPQKEMPRAILLAFVLIMLVFIPPTVAISLVVPADSTSLTAGVIQAYAAFFEGFGMPWATKIMAVLLIIGALGGVLAWTGGPSTGLLFVGKAGMLPPSLQKVNAKGVQKNILYLQAVIVTLLSTIYIFIDNVSDAFWMISAMAALMYLIIYVFMFLAAMKLRKTQPTVKRGFVLKGLHGWCYLGLFSTCVALIFGFIPPNNFSHMPFFEYAGILLIGLVIAGVPPFIFYAVRKPSWQMVPKAEADQYSAALQDLQDADDKAAKA
jgi:glutamate:GABA antiporter